MFKQFVVTAQVETVQLMSVTGDEFGKRRFVEKIARVQIKILQATNRARLHPCFQNLTKIWMIIKGRSKISR